jgi:hypothetical protein
MKILLNLIVIFFFILNCNTFYVPKDMSVSSSNVNTKVWRGQSNGNGGNTNDPNIGKVYEAELQTCNNQCDVVDFLPGYTGGGYVNLSYSLDENSSDSITWNQIEMSISGNYILEFKYISSESLNNNLPMYEVSVNGITMVGQEVDLPSDNQLSEWKKGLLFKDAPLKEGYNSITFKRLGKISIGIDHLKVK